MGSNAIGEIPVVVTGDFSQLSTALAEAQNAAQRSGSAIASALSQGAASADQGVKSLEDRIQSLIDSGHTLSEALKLDADAMAQISSSASEATTAASRLSDSIEPVAGGAEHAAQSLGEFGTQAHDAGEAAAHAHEGSDELLHTLLEFAGIAVSVEALKEFVLEAVETYAAVQKATVALGALMGSAEAAKEAIEGLKELALQDALSFPALLQAQQRLTAFGVSAEAIPGALNAIADAAAATNHDFGDTANTFERIIASGNAMGRTLVSLGLTTADLAKVMHVAEGDVKEAFKALDQQQRIEVLEQALKKFQGTAQAVADTLAGQWQKLRTQAEFTFEGIGEAVAPAAEALIKLASFSLSNLAPIIDQVKQISEGVVELYKNFSTLSDGLTSLLSAAIGAKVTLGDLVEVVRQMNVGFNAMLPALTLINNILKVYNETLGKYKELLHGVSDEKEGVEGTAKAAGDLAKVDAKPAAEGLQKTATALKDVSTNGKDASSLLKDLRDGLSDLTHIATTSGKAFQDAWNLSVMQTDFAGVNRAVRELLKTQTDAEVEYQQSLMVLGEVQKLHKLHQATLYDVVAAQNAVTEAKKKAHPELKTEGETVSTLTSAWHDYVTALSKIEDARSKVSNFAALWRDQVAQFGKDSDQARTAWKLLSDEIEKLGDKNIQSIKDLEPALSDVSTKITVLTGHLTDVDKAIPHLGTSIEVATFKMDAFGNVTKQATDDTKKFIDASSSIADQVAAGMTVITGHVKAATDQTGQLVDQLHNAGNATQNLTDLASHLVSPFDSVLNTLSEIYKMLGLIDQQTVTDTADAGAMANAESGALSGGGGEGGGGRGGGGMGNFPLFDPAHPENGGWTITWSTESGTGYPIAKMTYHQPYNLPPLAPGQSNTDFRNIFGQHPPSTGGAATPPAPAPDILGAYGGTSIPADMLKAFVDGTISADQLTAAMQALATVTQTSTRTTSDTQQVLQSATSDTSFALTGLSDAVQSTQQAVPQIVETLQSSFGKLESVTADTVSQLQVYQDYLKSINDLNSQIQAENAARHTQALSDAGAFPNAKIRLGLPDIPAAVPLPPSAFTPSGNINEFVIPAGRTTMMTVNINNPTIANQSVADRLVTQLRDMGMRT